MSDETEEDMSSAFPFVEGEVILHKCDRELYHVMNRVVDIDDGAEFVRLYDDTHTADSWWYLEDIHDCFVSTGEVVTGKPVQNMTEWYE